MHRENNMKKGLWGCEWRDYMVMKAAKKPWGVIHQGVFSLDLLSRARLSYLRGLMGCYMNWGAVGANSCK